MTRIYLVRHAQAEGNLYRRAHGMYDSLITPQGYAQIRALKERFADIPVDVVYSSPLFRARTTAAAIYVSKNIPMYVLNDLHEVDCGPWEDRTWGELRYHESAELENFNFHLERWSVPGAETIEQARDRMLSALRTVVREWPDSTIAVVTHGMAARVLLGTLQGMSLAEISEKFPHGDNTAVSLIECENDEFRVVFANDASHLEREISTFAQQNWWKGKEEMGLRFVPVDVRAAAGAELYQRCRAADWEDCGRPMEAYRGEALLAAARRRQEADSNAILAAYHDDDFAGLLELDSEAYAALGAGAAPMLYLCPAYRDSDADVQMIGEAVSRFRAKGLKHLRCAAKSPVTHRVAERCGLQPYNEDWMELYIGY